MKIFLKEEKPIKLRDNDASCYVFILHTNSHRFRLGKYDFTHDIWYDNEGMPIEHDFVWCYLPIKQMKAFIRIMEEKNK